MPHGNALDDWLETIERVKAPINQFRVVGLSYDALPFEADISLGIFNTLDDARGERDSQRENYNEVLIYNSEGSVVG